MHTFFYAVFGVGAVFIPVSALFLFTSLLIGKYKPVYVKKILILAALVVIVNGFLHVFTVSEPGDYTYADVLGNTFRRIMSDELGTLSSGGMIGALLGGGFYQLTGSKAISCIVLTVLLAADLMLLFEVTLQKVLTRLQQPAERVGRFTGDKIENTKKEIARKKQEDDGEGKSKRKKSGTKKSKNQEDDVTRVVDDFFSTSEAPETPEEPEPVRSPETRRTLDPTIENKVPEKDEFEIVSLFNPVKQGEAEGAAVKTGEPEVEQPSFFDMPSLQNNGDKPLSSAELNPYKFDDQSDDGEGKKPAPLTEEEAAAMESALDEGLNEPEKVEYHLPPLDLLVPPANNDRGYDVNELKMNGDKLIAALASFNVSASIVDVIPGPSVTRYELSPAPGVKISKFLGLADDLALHMAAPAGLRIEAPIPNKSAIGIEIPNRNRTKVCFREIIDTEMFRTAKSKLNVALGKDIAGDVIYSDLAKMPHLLVAGTTGSGKSVCMNTMIVSLLYNATPDEVRLLLIDPKKGVEFGVYNGLPHLLVPVVTDPRKAAGALGWAVTEMLMRYKTLNDNAVRDVAAYNALCDERPDLEKMPQIVIFIDELADLMTAAPAEVEESIQRLAQMARAAGMHLVIATQRPSVDVITGVIKANIPSRIALTVKSQVDSRTMIDQSGAEKLMGYGDMLYYPVGLPKPIRVQGAFLTDGEIENVVEFIKTNGSAQYDDAIQQEIERQAAAEKKKGAVVEEKPVGAGGGDDDLLSRAVELFVGTPEKASISALQRHLGLGFAKAGRLMDTLEEKGIVGPSEGSKPRKVLITKAQWYEMNAMSEDSAPAADVPFDYDDGGDGFIG
ncbi:MAG: DNA translocase FtsK [Clostridia bacterium]|nr:DNA translocase FtsK [Clostridia bacterium]